MIKYVADSLADVSQKQAAVLYRDKLVHFDLVLAPLLPCFILLVVKTDKVLACHVESVQMLDCLFRAKNVFVHYEASAFGLW